MYNDEKGGGGMSKKAKLRLVVYIVTSLLLSLAVMFVITAVSLIILFLYSVIVLPIGLHGAKNKND